MCLFLRGIRSVIDSSKKNNVEINGEIRLENKEWEKRIPQEEDEKVSGSASLNNK